jgi:phosphatidate cytidylyltransferase
MTTPPSSRSERRERRTAGETEPTRTTRSSRSDRSCPAAAAGATPGGGRRGSRAGAADVAAVTPPDAPTPQGRASRAARSAPTSRPTRSGRPGRAGRNLPAAIGVGLSLGAVIIASLFIRKEAFLAVSTLAACVGVWELRHSLAQGRIHVPMVPLLVGTVTMVVSAFVAGGQALMVSFGLTCVAVLLWRVADGLDDAVRDVAGGIFVAAYVPFLAAFSSLLLAAGDGATRIFVFVLVTVCSDVGGYAVGVVAGKHPMAPSVSPKKSWEGFAGSAAACVIGGVVSMTLLLGASWWSGVILGLAVVVTATVGDLTESTIKRDLGIKDMGHILPGHGGVMDRLDSLLLVAPVVWALLAVFVPLD